MTTVIDGKELRPCPFCGQSDLLGLDQPNWLDKKLEIYTVICWNVYCCASGPIGEGRINAIAKWNEHHRKSQR